MRGKRALCTLPYVAHQLRRSFQTIPVIDVAPLVAPNQPASARAVVAQQLDDACRNVGFFYVANHGMAPAVQEGVLAQARAWFALPAAVKDSIRIGASSSFRGYQGLGDNVTRYDGGFQRDWHEAIDLYREVEEGLSTSGRAGQTAVPSPIHGRNQWPSQLPAFEQVLRQYISGCLHLGEQLMQGIALALKLPDEQYFERAGASAQDSYWVTRVIHYPPLAHGSFHQATASGADAAKAATAAQLAAEAAAAASGAEVDRSVQLSCGEHTDYGLLTLVNQDAHIAALQVKNAAGQWITAHPIPGTFVCNIGDMLKVWTNGRYQPTAHRVLNADPTRSRVSIPFFYEPAYDARIAPLPQLCSAEHPSAYAPMRYGDHLEAKVLSNFELDAATA